jgi:hypothetical protein
MKYGNKNYFVYAEDDGSIFSHHVFKKDFGRCFCVHLAGKDLQKRFYLAITWFGKKGMIKIWWSCGYEKG